MNNKDSKLKAVILDWAGTTVDYGCFAPTSVFIEVFREKGVGISVEEARAAMGMHKRDHIKYISTQPRIAALWQEIYYRPLEERDIDSMFEIFIPLQLKIIEKYSAIVPELPAALEIAREYGLKVGSTTGYNREMMDILAPLAAEQGYTPDAIICASEVRHGRPAPWMAFKCAEILGVYPMSCILKIGDTVTDIQEGLNAGMWSVGVVMSSNEMGLSLDEVRFLAPHQREEKKAAVRKKFLDAGAHFVIDTLRETGDVIRAINEK